MKLTATCSQWLESVLKKELEKLDFKIIKTEDKTIEFEWWDSAIERANINLRTANKVYLKLWEWETLDFDSLFDFVNQIDWKALFPKDCPFVVKVKSIKSKLESEISIQKIVHKAIIKSKVWNDYYNADDKLSTVSVQVLIKNDLCQILLDTSWDALHKRGYRMDSGEAPLKETIAAGLVQLSNWKFKDTFYDVLCWSWTIAIEAAMIARNIAPGLIRTRYAFRLFTFSDKENYEKELEIAKSKIFNWNHKLVATDIDIEMIWIAKENARRAWVLDIINFEVKDVHEYLNEDFEGHLVSNPPYWERIWEEDHEDLHKTLIKLFKKNNLTGWIYTSNEIGSEMFKNRKLYNWGLKCYFYIKKRD